MRDWKKGEGRTHPGQDDAQVPCGGTRLSLLYERMVRLGQGVEKNGVFAHGLTIPVADAYQEL